MRKLSEHDITLIKDEVSNELSTHVKATMSTTGQAFGTEILAEIVSKVILPIIVSLSSQALYDVLKGKTLGSLKKTQADRLSREMIGAELHDSRQLDEACMAELKRELLPLGIKEEEIQDLFVKIRQRLQQMILILFLAADPSDASRLRLGEELREIQEKLQLAKLRERFELHQRTSVRPADISQVLLDVQPQIVHFSGHGTSDGALCFENLTGQTQFVQPDALAELFEQFTNEVNCVLLNACFSETQAEAIARHIKYVIGMNKAIGDKAAIAFAIGFYQALGGGRTIEDAYKLGCVQIRLQGIPENLTPVLIEKGATQS